MGAPQRRREFWQAFKAHMSAASLIGCSRVSSDGWMWHSADLSSGYLASLLNVRLGQIGVRYRLNEANADTVFSFLQTRRAEIDGAFESAVSWRSGDAGSHVIEVMREADIAACAAWPEQMDWLRRHLEAFQGALWPLVGRVPPARERRRWDEELFFRELSQWNPSGLAPATEIFAWARRRGEVPSWGRGGQTGSFTPTVTRHGVACQLVSVRTDGTLQLLFARLKDSQGFADRARRVELLAQTNRVRHFALPDETLDQRPAVPLAMLADPTVGGEFLGLLDWFHGAATLR
jgi:hypothetical protein